MAMIKMPQKAPDQTSKFLTIGGAVAGGLIGGGPAGAMAGAQAGGMLGGLASQPQQEVQAVGGGNAMSRRMGQLDQTPLRQIRESIDSLKYIDDPNQRMALAQPLLQADYMARQKGMA